MDTYTYFSEVLNSIVITTEVASQEIIDAKPASDSIWVETDPNTRGNLHYSNQEVINKDGKTVIEYKPDSLPAMRGNYGLRGYTYDGVNDVFYPQKPYPSYVLNQTTWTWEAPVPYPTDKKLYRWNEETGAWDQVTA